MIKMMTSVALIGLSSAALAADGEWIKVTGTASKPGSDKLLYTEHHQILRKDGLPLRHRVQYRDPQGELIADKQVDYSRSAAAPAFELRDSRSNYQEGARYNGEQYLLFRTEPGSEQESKAQDLGPDLVVDAGFDGFVRQNIASLRQGKTIDFRLGVAGSLRSFDFRAKMTGERQLEGRTLVDIRVEPDSMLRWFVDPLELVYAADPVQLLEYRGRTNIRKPDGDSRYDAVIRFGDEQAIEAPESAAAQR